MSSKFFQLDTRGHLTLTVFTNCPFQQSFHRSQKHELNTNPNKKVSHRAPKYLAGHCWTLLDTTKWRSILREYNENEMEWTEPIFGAVQLDRVPGCKIRFGGHFCWNGQKKSPLSQALNKTWVSNKLLSETGTEIFMEEYSYVCTDNLNSENRSHNYTQGFLKYFEMKIPTDFGNFIRAFSIAVHNFCNMW